jgi:BlaI family transcriptional regulator, penicillinase repressor
MNEKVPKVNLLDDLHPRERQIMEIVYRLGRATAVQVMAELPDDLSNPAVRKMLNNLEAKGCLVHESVKGQFFYSPTVTKEKARSTTLNHLLNTFYRNEEEQAVLAILRKSEVNISQADIEEITGLIRKARGEGR